MNVLTRGGAVAGALIIVLLGIPLVLMNVTPSPQERLDQATILANITQGLAYAGTLKASVNEHFYSHGQLPGGAVDLGLDGPSAKARRLRQGLAIGPQGLITVHVRDTSDAIVGSLLIRPLVQHPSRSLDWECTTGDFRRIQRFVPQCTYIGARGGDD